MLTTERIRLPVWPRHEPVRIRSANPAIRSSTRWTSPTTFRPSTTKVSPGAARNATWSTGRSSVVLMRSPRNIASTRSANPARRATAINASRIRSVTRFFDRSTTRSPTGWVSRSARPGSPANAARRSTGPVPSCSARSAAHSGVCSIGDINLLSPTGRWVSLRRERRRATRVRRADRSSSDPLPVGTEHTVGGSRSPATPLVGDDGTPLGEDGLHDPPCLHDPVLTGEQPGVAAEGIGEEAVVSVPALGTIVPEVKVDGTAHHLGPGALRLHRQGDPVVGFCPEGEAIRSRSTSRRGEEGARGTLELDGRLGHGGGHSLAGPDDPRHAGPSPRVHLETHRSESLCFGLLCHAGLVAVAGGLAAHHVLQGERPHRPDDLHPFIAQSVGMVGHRWLHRKEREHLQKMVLDDVANGPDRVVERPP